MSFESASLLALASLALILTIGSAIALKDLRIAPRAPPPPLPGVAKRWKQSGLYLLILISTAFLTSILDRWLLSSIGWSRNTAFLSSFAAFILIFLLGVVFEDRLLWKGYFSSYVDSDGKRKFDGRLMPSPVTLGLSIGLLSFLVHDTARPWAQ